MSKYSLTAAYFAVAIVGAFFVGGHHEAPVMATTMVVAEH